MGTMFVDIKVLGKGIVKFSSGSSYVLTQSSDWQRTAAGTYDNNTSPKFFIVGNLIQTSIGILNNATITSSSIDRSFTISSSASTASIRVIFEPEKQSDGIIPRKDGKMIESTPSYSTLSSTDDNSSVPIDYFMSNPTQIGPAQSGREAPTQKDYDRGYMFRYLYRQINNENDNVKEVTEKQYQSISSFYLYKSIKIKWKIVGSKLNAVSINSTIADQAENELKGSKSLLMRDPLLFWKNLPDIVEEFDVTQKVIQSGGA